MSATNPWAVQCGEAVERIQQTSVAVDANDQSSSLKAGSVLFLSALKSIDVLHAENCRQWLRAAPATRVSQFKDHLRNRIKLNTIEGPKVKYLVGQQALFSVMCGWVVSVIDEFAASSEAAKALFISPAIAAEFRRVLPILVSLCLPSSSEWVEECRKYKSRSVLSGFDSTISSRLSPSLTRFVCGEVVDALQSCRDVQKLELLKLGPSEIMDKMLGSIKTRDQYSPLACLSQDDLKSVKKIIQWANRKTALKNLTRWRWAPDAFRGLTSDDALLKDTLRQLETKIPELKNGAGVAFGILNALASILTDPERFEEIFAMCNISRPLATHVCQSLCETLHARMGDFESDVGQALDSAIVGGFEGQTKVTELIRPNARSDFSTYADNSSSSSSWLTAARAAQLYVHANFGINDPTQAQHLANTYFLKPESHSDYPGLAELIQYCIATVNGDIPTVKRPKILDEALNTNSGSST